LPSARAELLRKGDVTAIQMIQNRPTEIRWRHSTLRGFFRKHSALEVTLIFGADLWLSR
jgi:hypothetical protein